MPPLTNLIENYLDGQILSKAASAGRKTSTRVLAIHAGIVFDWQAKDRRIIQGRTDVEKF
jgi:hypothetical protein